MKPVQLKWVRIAVPLRDGGTGRSQVYTQAPCGCLFRSHRGGYTGHEAVWHPCLKHGNR